MRTIFVALAATVIPLAALAQNEAKPGAVDKAVDKWDVAAPPLEMRKIPIAVDEGTWMNVDVSPDGRTVAFDLLGDIYTMPIAGGAAKRIAEGMPFEMQPRFSPDGSMIVFTSDRGGGDNIWIMNKDGSDKRQLTHENFRMLNSPDWSPDGRFIVARKHFTTGRSLGTGELWLYHLGGGDGVRIVKRPNDAFQKELGEPVFAPDGKNVYFSRNTTSGNTFEYAQDSNTQVFAIDRVDVTTGEIDRVVGGAGGAVRPAPSPDGKHLAFVKRERGKSALFLKDLSSSAVRKLYDGLDQDMQEGWAIHGVYPTMDWTPDSKSIVFWAGGKIRRVDLNGRAAEIPFRVADERDVIDPIRPQVEVAPATVATKMPRFAAASPDGRSIVFESLGKLYIKSGGAARRLTGANDEMELFPSWSRDGKRIVYVGWTDAGLGTVRTVSAGGGRGAAVAKTPGHYRRPRFSPDGRTIVFEQGAGGYLLSNKYSDAPGVYTIAASGGEAVRISDDGGSPHFGKDNDRIFMTVRDDGQQKLVSIDRSGNERRTHATADLAVEFQVSPDSRFVAFRENYAAYVMPLTPGPQDVGAGKSASAMMVTKASKEGASYLNWSSDRLGWSLGPTFYSASVKDMLPTLPKGAGTRAAYEPPASGVSLSLTVPADKPKGVVALTGARIITMTDDDGGVIEDGVLVIDGNRIVAVGAAGETAIPAGAKIVDAAGKTITPGFIDAHAHGSQGDDDIVPQQNWLAMAHLALGVTTVHDPSNSASEIFPAAEMQRTGQIIAPRIFSSGDIVYGARSAGNYAEINSFEDALAHVRRLKAQGALSIKNYNQPRREQRQMVVAAAQQENIAVVAEGGSLFTQDVTIIADGNTSLEHNFPQSKLYEDVLSFFSQTKVAYTPTLVVTFGGLNGDSYWRYATDVWKHPILSKNVPPHILQPRSVRRTKAPEEDFADQYSAAAAKALADRGVAVSIGAHGQEEGLATHWEMWSFVRGGMTPVEALKAATATPARHLGLDQDIGTLAAGKLADLVIMNANPLDDIRNTDHIDKVMVNGRLYDAATMNEVVTGTRKRAPYYWE